MDAAKQGILPVVGAKMEHDLKVHSENKANLRKKYISDREKSHRLRVSLMIFLNETAHCRSRFQLKSLP